MRFSLSSEQRDLRDAFSELMASRASLSTTRALVDGGMAQDPSVWADLVDMGVVTVDFPEEVGGADLGAVELAVVMEVAGSVLYPGPLMSTTGFAAGLLGQGDASAGLRGRVAEGLRLAAVVPAWSGSRSSVKASRSGDEWTLSGEVPFVLGADQSDLLLVVAATDDGVESLFSVPSSSARIEIPAAMEPARPLATVQLSDASATVVEHGVGGQVSSALRRARLALAAESLGAARAALELTSQHVTSRHQFGQPIGAFQAVRHTLANLVVDIEMATSAVYLAACHLDASDPDVDHSVAMALNASTRALKQAAANAVQLHGGMGFTWETGCHWFVSWGQTSSWLLGSNDEWSDEVYARATSLAG